MDQTQLLEGKEPFSTFRLSMRCPNILNFKFFVERRSRIVFYGTNAFLKHYPIVQCASWKFYKISKLAFNFVPLILTKRSKNQINPGILGYIAYFFSLPSNKFVKTRRKLSLRWINSNGEGEWLLFLTFVLFSSSRSNHFTNSCI